MSISGRGSSSMAIALSDELLDFAHDGLGLAGLGEIAIAAYLHCLLAVRSERVRRERDDRDAARFRIALEHLGRLPTIDHGDRDVHQNQVRAFGARLGDTLLTVERLHNDVAEMLENGRVDDTIVFVVFDQKYCLTTDAHASPHPNWGPGRAPGRGKPDLVLRSAVEARSVHTSTVPDTEQSEFTKRRVGRTYGVWSARFLPLGGDA